jgi:hypothetical protein
MCEYEGTSDLVNSGYETPPVLYTSPNVTSVSPEIDGNALWETIQELSRGCNNADDLRSIEPTPSKTERKAKSDKIQGEAKTSFTPERELVGTAPFPCFLFRVHPSFATVSISVFLLLYSTSQIS